MTDNTDLLTLLRKLGDGKIDDLSVAHDAMEEIVHLRIRVDELYEDKERWYRMCELHTVRLQELQAELDAIKRNNSYCPMCGSGTVPSVPDDTALLRQALEALDELLYANTTKSEKMTEAAVKALRERLR